MPAGSSRRLAERLARYRQAHPFSPRGRIDAEFRQMPVPVCRPGRLAAHRDPGNGMEFAQSSRRSVSSHSNSIFTCLSLCTKVPPALRTGAAGKAVTRARSLPYLYEIPPCIQAPQRPPQLPAKLEGPTKGCRGVRKQAEVYTARCPGRCRFSPIPTRLTHARSFCAGIDLPRGPDCRDQGRPAFPSSAQ